MRPFILIAIAFLIARGAVAASPATGPTTASSTRPALNPIDMTTGIYLLRYERRITVSADGLLRSVTISGKSYGPGDIDPKMQRVETREGRLTPEQTADLVRLFTGWDALSSDRYPSVPDDIQISLRYGDKTVSGGNGVPEQVKDLSVKLTRLAESMPLVKP